MAAPNLGQTWRAKALAVGLGAFAVTGVNGVANDAKAEQLPQPTPVALTEEANDIAQIVIDSIQHAQNTEEVGIQLLLGNKEINAGWTPEGLGKAIEGLLSDMNIPSEAFTGFSGQEESAIGFNFVDGVEELGPYTFEGTLASLETIEERFEFQKSYLNYKRQQEGQEVAAATLD